MNPRIGEYFVGIQLLSLEQLEEVLKRQDDYPGMKFGEVAVKLGYLEQRDIDEFLEEFG
jgi:hypothetical protein